MDFWNCSPFFRPFCWYECDVFVVLACCSRQLSKSYWISVFRYGYMDSKQQSTNNSIIIEAIMQIGLQTTQIIKLVWKADNTGEQTQFVLMH